MQLFLLLVTCLSLLSNAVAKDNCDGCEQVDYECEFGANGCGKQAEECGAQCCQSSFSWLLGCRGCRSDCDDAEQACIAQCRDALSNCHESCDVVCCDSTRDCYPMSGPFENSWPKPLCHNPSFRLYRSDIHGWEPITHTSLPAQYKAHQKTIVIVHGWRTTPEADWIQDAKDAFLAQEESNVIVVDWEAGAAELYYPQSASNVRVTGSEIASILDLLQPSAMVWCIGESLGAHCCGHAGKKVHLDRISGLDPAGPMFELDACAADADKCRLYHTDASQVVAIHTDAKDTVDSYGTITPIGDIDFYPNGIGRQPGCPADGLDLGCSHMKVRDYFVSSILKDCFVTEKYCTNENNLPGSCLDCQPGDCPNMGASTDFGKGIYYLTTTADYPYCKG